MSGKSSDGEVDIWRDTPVRLLGYANEVGESFRALVHTNVVRATYVISFGYCLADTVDKTMKMATKPNSSRDLVVKTAADTLIWQTLASVLIPGFTINRICALSLFVFRKAKFPSVAAKWTTTAIGLGSIGLIYQPIDHLVDYFMDNTFRKAF
ncbi:unnamed protein product [Allacma fusca]|uniref:Mitochondrial fission process protein 1 n=1 Tax=Allacma fusca TaxID=39272 RepID=A0A8J2J4N1_9HEXA|nr:unnamed protein product [Allacma fusca]